MNNPLNNNFNNGALLGLRYFGDPVLTRKTEAVSCPPPESIRGLATEMIATMHKEGGIGLAAPQVGYETRLTVIDIRPDTDNESSLSSSASAGERLLLPLMPAALLNPLITKSSVETSTCDEGCLSLPGIQAPVERPERIVLQANLLDGSEIKVECGGLLSRCLQHEIDHLDGITFEQRLTKPEFARIKKQLKKIQKIHSSL